MKNIPILFLGLICFYFSTISCNQKQSPPSVVPAFYHWQTGLQLTKKINDDLQKIGIKKLYVKFFDLDWSEKNGEILPQAILIPQPDFLENYQIIPTIFITNRALLNASEALVERAAFKTAERLKAEFEKGGFNDIPEIQFDCDWTEKTRSKFFMFLEKFKKYWSEKIELSATIRLHQIKYFEKTGVPPVKRGMLMFYNMSDVSDILTQNSILDLEEAQKYLVNFDRYPLPLDLVLPAYSWGVLFRDGKLTRLFPGIYPSDCQLFTKVDSNLYQVKSGTYFKEQFLYENDRLRLENADIDDLLKAGEILAPLLKKPTLTVGFYHLHEHSFKRYSHEDYSKVLGKF